MNTHLSTKRVAAVAATIAALGLAAGAPARASTPPIGDATGGAGTTEHWHVVAQGLVALTTSAYEWQVGAVTAPGTYDARGATFLVAGPGPDVTVAGEDGAWLLQPGEAALRRDTTASTLGAPGPATITTISLAGTARVAGDIFLPGEGWHDVSLVRDHLSSGEELRLASPHPALVLVRSGVAIDSTGADLVAGESASYSGDVVLTNDGTEPAEIYVAIVSASIADAHAPAPPTMTVAPAPTSLPSPAPTSTIAPTTTSTLPPNGDSDADGLDNQLESELGTDPLDEDTDDDNARDGDEVLIYMSDPLKPDTDGDGITDESEVGDYGTDPTTPDSDGDGIDDFRELNFFMTDPNNSDSDGDGLPDGEEATAGTDPSVIDTDGDGLDDYQEIKVRGTDPNDVDTDDDGASDGVEFSDADGDGLPFTQEQALGTDPGNADTDGDGVNDLDEQVNGTNPLDAASY